MIATFAYISVNATIVFYVYLQINIIMDLMPKIWSLLKKKKKKYAFANRPTFSCGDPNSNS